VCLSCALSRGRCQLATFEQRRRDDRLVVVLAAVGLERELRCAKFVSLQKAARESGKNCSPRRALSVAAAANDNTATMRACHAILDVSRCRPSSSSHSGVRFTAKASK
jgi:hypothetical protein